MILGRLLPAWPLILLFRSIFRKPGLPVLCMIPLLRWFFVRRRRLLFLSWTGRLWCEIDG